MNILISPYAQKLKNGKTNPKNYPYWEKLIELLKHEGHTITQVGVSGETQLVNDFKQNLPLNDLAELIKQYDTWISVDSFFQHFSWDIGKFGIVLWGPSDPLIFGHPENVNLIKNRNNLRPDQFYTWEQCDNKPEIHVDPEFVIKHIHVK